MMPTPVFTHFPQTHVTGIVVETTNALEADPATARIPALWGRFMGESLENKIAQRAPDGRMFSVYTGYESDYRGRYTIAVAVEVLGAGAVPDGLKQFVLPAGTYLVFDAAGQMPRAVVQAWQAVWQYFESSRMRRAYTTDFEVYDRDKVRIYIALQENNMQNEMMDAVKAGDLNKVSELLKTDPALVNARDDQGNSAVLIAAYWGKTEVRDALLARKPTLTIFEAAATGQSRRVEELAALKPAELTAFSHDGFTPLHLAVFFGHGAIAKFLLAHNADVGAVSHNPMMVQPLHSAAAGNDLDICQALLEHGADVNAVQQDGFTPLMAAAQNGNRDMVELLLRHGAKRSAKNAHGKTAGDIASENGHDVIAKALV